MKTKLQRLACLNWVWLCFGQGSSRGNGEVLSTIVQRYHFLNRRVFYGILSITSQFSGLLMNLFIILNVGSLLLSTKVMMYQDTEDYPEHRDLACFSNITSREVNNAMS